jgi:putative membrane protein
MFGRTRRTLPALAAAIAAVLVGASSFALADEHHHSRHHERSHEHHCNHDRKCDQGRYSAWDEQWLMMSIQGDRFEIAGGQLAQEKGKSNEVQELGARLVADHTKSLEDAIAVAEELGIDVPDSPSPTQQWQLRVLSRFSGHRFDRWYADLEVQDHIQDISEAQDEVDEGCNDDIQQLAADDLPVLKEHLALAQAALAAVTED